MSATRRATHPQTGEFGEPALGYTTHMSDDEQHEAKTIDYPGRTAGMPDQPRDEMRDYRGRDLLAGRKALVTGGDSGIGRAVAVAFAKEGADVAIAYLEEDDDARRTVELIEEQGRSGRAYPGDLADQSHCADVVQRTVDDLGGLDLLVNNVAFQSPVDDFLDLEPDQWRRTFDVNICLLYTSPSPRD